MEVKLSLNKDVNGNADSYFSQSKKLRSKLEGIDRIISITKQEIKKLEDKKTDYEKKEEFKEKVEGLIEREWYEKFRYTFTSSGFLFVIGKDAASNEVLIKKHANRKDVIFHTQEAGSPFGILKEGFLEVNDEENFKLKASETDLYEAAQFLACFSAQWKAGRGSADVFWVILDQVSKEAQSGEFLSKGSFMVRGKRHFMKNVILRICCGVRVITLRGDDDEKIEINELFSGSQAACEKYCKGRYLKLEPGQLKYKQLTKEIKTRLKISPQDLPKLLPNECKIMKN